MPWEDKTVEKTRLEFVKRVLAREKSKSALCREYGISRPTGDKWIERYNNDESLSDRSRKPFHTPNKIDSETENRIVEARQKEPAIGAKKTRQMLINSGWENPPSVSTINAVFKRNNLITQAASEAATPYKRFEKSEPNEMWQADFKGDFAMLNGQRCYPLSIIDDCSRFCINADAKDNQRLKGVKNSFISAFREYGMPYSLLCDNGNPWGSSQSGAITKFEVWLMELGVLTIHIRPLHPQAQGKVERFNGSYKRERLNFYTPANLEDAQICREEYKSFYNNVRPHESINMEVPAKKYIRSKIEYSETIVPWEYESGAIIRKIKSSGYLTFGGQGYFLSEGLSDKVVALFPTEIDGILNIVFRQFRVAKLNLHTNTIISRRVYLLHNDPRKKL